MLGTFLLDRNYQFTDQYFSEDMCFFSEATSTDYNLPSTEMVVVPEDTVLLII